MPLPSKFSANSPQAKAERGKLPPLEATLLPESATVDASLRWRVGIFFLLILALVVVAIGGSVAHVWMPEPKLVSESITERHAALQQGFRPQQRVVHPERVAIERLLSRAAAVSQKQNQAQFLTFVNLDKLHERIVMHPLYPQQSAPEKRELRERLTSDIDALTHAAKLRLVSLQSLDEKTAVAYAIAEQPYGHSEPMRIWLQKNKKQWLLIDWDFVDFGYSLSERYAYAAAAEADPQGEQYRLSQEYLNRATKFRNEGKREEAETQLRLAAACKLPSCIRDFHLYSIMLQWSEMYKHEEVVKICNQADAENRSPGFHYHRARALSYQSQRTAAIDATLAYQQGAGFQPDVVELRARMLQELGRNSESLALYEQLQKNNPHHTQGLVSLYRLLPEGRKDEWLTYIAATNEPLQTAVEQGESALAYRLELACVKRLEKYVAGIAPHSVAHLRLQGVLLQEAGECERAAAVFRQAAALSKVEAEQTVCWGKYLTAMAEMGKPAEAISEHPRPDEAFESYVMGFEDDECELSAVEVRELVKAQLLRNPQHGRANYLAGVLALRAGDETGAKDHLERVAADASNAGDGQEEDEEDREYRQSQAKDSLLLLAVRRGETLATWQAAEDQVNAYQQLAGHCLSEKNWPALQQLNDAARISEAGRENAWLRYYDAKIAIQQGQPGRAVQQILRAKLEPEHEGKNPGKHYLEYTQSEILVEALGVVSAYQQHPDQKTAFERYHSQALWQRDWQAASELRAAHRQTHPGDLALLTAEVGAAEKTGNDQRIIQLLQPWPGNEKFTYPYQAESARGTLVLALARQKQFVAALAAIDRDDEDGPSWQLLVHLLNGDRAAAAAVCEEHRQQHPNLLSDLATEHPQEWLQIRTDPRVAELVGDLAASLHDEFSAGIAMLAAERDVWTLESLQSKFAAVVPGIEFGAPQPHQHGTSYALKLPNETYPLQLTIGNARYAGEDQLIARELLPHELQQRVLQHQSWLALEMAANKPAEDRSWRLLRTLMAAAYNVRARALGVCEPGGYGFNFYAVDGRIVEQLRATQPLAKLLAGQPSGHVEYVGESNEAIGLRVSPQIRQFVTAWEAGVKPRSEIRIAVQRGRRCEHLWLPLVRLERDADQTLTFFAQPSTADIDAHHLPPGMIRCQEFKILEIRAAN